MNRFTILCRVFIPFVMVGLTFAMAGQKPETRGKYFYKYEALGNDYIVLDPEDWPEPPPADLIRRICDRHRGVGSDGIPGKTRRTDGGQGSGLTAGIE